MSLLARFSFGLSCGDLVDSHFLISLLFIAHLSVIYGEIMSALLMFDVFGVASRVIKFLWTLKSCIKRYFVTD